MDQQDIMNQVILEIEAFDAELEERRPKTWSIDIKPSEKNQTPTFIRLFVINRVLQNYLSQHKTNISDDNVNVNAIRSLISGFNNSKDQENAFCVLSKLVKHGIKTYMNEHCNYNDTTTHVIDQIFDKLILKKLNQEYDHVTTYSMNHDNNINDNDDYYYQCTVFNTKDLMCMIFQYCQIYNRNVLSDGYNCSLVRSHWLYYSFNPNSTYHVALDQLMCKRSLMIDNPRNARLWQRMVNVKSASFNSFARPNEPHEPDDFILSKVLMLTNIEKVMINSLRPWPNSEHLSIIVALMQQCSMKIKDFYIRVYDRQGFPPCAMPPLKLLNAEKIGIRMHDLYFYIIWSNKCKRLSFHDVVIDNDNWINFMIDNCDCSGVEHLKFVNAQFWWGLIDNQEIIVPNFIKTFTNLEQISIEFFQSKYQQFLEFWHCLNVLVCKQNVYVTLELRGFSDKNCHEILQAVEKNRLKIDSIRMEITMSEAKIMCNMMVGIGMNNNQLNLEHIYICSLWNGEGIKALEIFIKRLNELVSIHATISKEILMKTEHEKQNDKQMDANNYKMVDEKKTIANKLNNKKKEQTKDNQKNIDQSQESKENNQSEGGKNANIDDIKHLLIHCKMFMPRLKVISINQLFLPLELSFVNEIILKLFEFVHQLKRQMYIDATFYVSRLDNSFIGEYCHKLPLVLKEFKKFCQSMLDALEQEFVIPFNVELQFPSTDQFTGMVDEMKQILSTFSEKIKLIQYKQPHQENEHFIASSMPIFCSTVKHRIHKYSFQFGNCVKFESL